ncbi:MAG: LemA family protein [Clostridia bacterium]|nr:LemA family protein [Clostridia bacterium]MDR3645445.1 LemA family protein [Clostridia bacterium]
MGTAGWVIIALVVIIILWAIAAYNSLIKLRNDSEEAFSTMDVFLRKRFDLIPNLVETVKGYAKHESTTLENVIKARNTAVQAGSAEEKINADNALTGTLKTLFAVAEAYPDLKANANFIDLQNQLKNIETEIANSRRYYNAVAKSFNIKTEVFPSTIIASLFHFEKKPLYVIDEEQRENVKVQF